MNLWRVVVLIKITNFCRFSNTIIVESNGALTNKKYRALPRGQTKCRRRLEKPLDKIGKWAYIKISCLLPVI